MTAKAECRTCKYHRRLVHNFIPGEGWGDGLCCVVFAEKGPVYETSAEDFCERYTDSTEIQSNVFDEREVHENVTVEILSNSVTGEQSIGWYANE